MKISSLVVPVDVVIPAYNAAKYIGATLRSIALQTVAVNSIIIVNDGSIDDTLIVIDEFSNEFPHIAINVISQANAGLSNARNSGIKLAAAEFVALLDSDDIWHPAKIEKQLNIFVSTPDTELGVVYCDYSIIDENGFKINADRFVLDPRVKGDVRDFLCAENCIAGSASAVLIRREIFERVGLFDESLRSAEDWDMWIRLSEAVHFDYVQEQLVDIRRHSQSMQANVNKMLEGELVLLNKLLLKGMMKDSHVNRLRQQVSINSVAVQRLACWSFLDKRIKAMFSGLNFYLWAVAFRFNRRFRIFVKRMRGYILGY